MMQIEQTRPTQIRLTLHSFELATLVSTARWVADGPAGELPPGVVAQIRQLVADYDSAWQEKKETVL